MSDNGVASGAGGGVGGVFDADEVREVLRDSFYHPDLEVPTVRVLRRRGARRKPKPTHYDVICISLYKEDLAQLDKMVAKLKKQGHRRISRSALIRFALDQVDIRDLPRAY